MNPNIRHAYHEFRRMGYKASFALDYARVEDIARSLNLRCDFEPEKERYEDVFGDLDDHVEETQRRIDDGTYDCMWGHVDDPATGETLASCGMFVAEPGSPDWRGFAADLLAESVSILRKRYEGTI